MVQLGYGLVASQLAVALEQSPPFFLRCPPHSILIQSHWVVAGYFDLGKHSPRGHIMKSLIAGLLAIALGLSTIAPLMITDAAFAAGKAAKSSKKKGKKGAALAKSCGTYMYWDAKAKKCADARDKK